MKAGAVPVRRGMTAAEGFATIVSACVRHFRLNEPLMIEMRSGETLHQVRVAMRRLRCALGLFKAIVRGEQFQRFRQELRWFAGLLGEARNLDVYLEWEIGADEGLEIEEKREAAYDEVMVAMTSHRFQQLMLEIVSWSATGDFWGAKRGRRSLRPFMNRRIDRLWREVSATRGLGRMTQEDRHRLRLQTKKLRYAVEFAAGLHACEASRRKRFRRAVRQLQDELGLLNDAAVARTLRATDSSLAEPGRVAIDERVHVEAAKSALRRMRKVGPYWRR